MPKSSRRLSKLLTDFVLVAPAQRFLFAKQALLYATEKVFGHIGDPYEELKERFIDYGRHSKWDCETRREIVRRFEIIDREIDIATTRPDGLFLAHALLSLDAEGAIVECGCFNGGSTAKLSVLAKITGREMVVFDSFEGLPQAVSDQVEDANLRLGDHQQIEWVKGHYSASVEKVSANVERYGEGSVCRYVKGWFEDTVNEDNLPQEIAFAFVDVDIGSSARDCLRGIWPRLAEGSPFFSHDAPFVKVLEAFSDKATWDAFGEPPPVIYGAGFGFGDASPFLAMMVKGAIDVEHIHRLTLENRPQTRLGWISLRDSA